MKKKRSEYVGKIISDSLKPKTQFKTKKKRNPKNVAKITKKFFLVKVPSGGGESGRVGAQKQNGFPPGGGGD